MQGTRFAQLRAIPTLFYYGFAAYSLLTVGLMAVSFALATVVAPQGYYTVAMAKPAAQHRLIRQTEVAQFGSKVSTAFGIKDQVATEFADWILEASERQGLTPELLASLVVTESSFRKYARSQVGAVGPAQVRPEYWGSFCGASTQGLSDPEENIYCGAQILSHLLERCDGDRACALAAYNIGPYGKRDAAARRYLAKIDRYLASLEDASL
ncbi:MAG: lytic transglycosylase domain-containing protein [Pseudomonadota bacterium]